MAAKCWKQKSVTRSSTEAEWVGASDYLPHPIWVQYFMEAQGYKMVENTLEQDNESAIKLETNGRMSAGPKSRHVNIRYFWMKDRVKSERITIRHCPTLVMLADFLTKPLQGALFRKFRDVLLGRAHVDSLTCLLCPRSRSVLEMSELGAMKPRQRVYCLLVPALPVPLLCET